MSAPTKQTAAKRPANSKAKSRVTHYVDQQLERTRRQVKSTDLISAGLLLMVTIVGFFLLLAVIDAWVLTLTPLMRWSALLLLVGGCVCMMVFSIWPLLTKKINPDYAAKMLEESKPGFRNSVLNYVWFRKKPENIRSAVFDAVARQAAVDLNSVPTDSSVDRSKLIRLGFWLVGVTAAFIIYFMLSPKNPFQTLNRILFPGADLAKPAVVTISEVTPGTVSVFFGDQVEITAKVYGQHSPEDVKLVYSTNDGRQSGQVMIMEPDPTTPRQYKIDLTKNTGGLRESLEYEIIARDGQSGKFEINVAPRPAITIDSIQIIPPKYTKLKPHTTLQGDIDGVEGAKIVLNAAANLEIENASIELLNEVPTAPNQDQRFILARAPLDMKVDSKTARRTFQLTLDANREKPMATHYRLNFNSVTGKSPEALNAYPIRIIPDLAPELEIKTPTAAESKIPANGRLAVVATANDLDYEIAFIKIDIEHRGNQVRSKELPLKRQADNGQRAQARFEIKPDELGLSVGDQAIFYLTAGDNRTTYFSDTDPAPNLFSSKKYSFTVTEPNELGSSPPEKNQNQDPPPSEKNPENNPQDPPKNEPPKGNEGREDPDNGSDDGNKSEDKQESGEDQNLGDTGEPKGESGANDPGQENQSEQNQPGENDPNNQPEDPSGGDSDPGSEGEGESNPQSADGDRGESQEGAGAEGEGDPESAAEDGGGGASDQPQQNSTSDNAGGSESNPGGNDPQNKTDGGGNQERPSDGDPNTDASDARQGDNPSGNNASQTAPEKRDNSLTKGDEEVLSEEASEAEQIRQLDKLRSEDPDVLEKPAGPEQSNTEQESDAKDSPEGEDSGKSENSQPKQEGNPSESLGKENQQPRQSGDQSNQPKQDQETGEQTPNSQGPESQGPDSQGPESQGPESQGPESQGPESQGPESQGPESQGPESQGPESQGPESQGPESQGPESQGPESQGPESQGPESQGPESQGPESQGPESQGPESQGPESQGPESQGPESQGPESQGPESQGPESQGPESQGPESQGPESQGPESQGPESQGPESQGPESQGPESQGPESQGPESQGPESQGSESQGSQPGSEAQGSGSPGSSESSKPGEASGQPGGQPGDGPGQQGDPSADSKPSDQPGSEGGKGAGQGDVGIDELIREKENLEYSRKKIDLLLDDLRNQRHNPNQELLKRMNWDKQDLNDFIDSWDEMKAAAEQGDAKAKRQLKRRRIATGLRPDSNRRSVAGNEEEVGDVNIDGVVNQAPPEQRYDFNSFLQDLQRARQ